MQALVRVVAMTAFAWLVFTPSSVPLAARTNNCFCDGISTGWIALVFLDPICAQEPYGSQTYADTALGCQVSCTQFADAVTPPLVCGQECERSGSTQTVFRWSWDGYWEFTGTNPDAQSHNSGGQYYC